jgi:hypothetical protein
MGAFSRSHAFHMAQLTGEGLGQLPFKANAINRLDRVVAAHHIFNFAPQLLDMGIY